MDKRHLSVYNFLVSKARLLQVKIESGHLRFYFRRKIHIKGGYDNG